MYGVESRQWNLVNLSRVFQLPQFVHSGWLYLEWTGLQPLLHWHGVNRCPFEALGVPLVALALGPNGALVAPSSWYRYQPLPLWVGSYQFLNVVPLATCVSKQSSFLSQLLPSAIDLFPVILRLIIVNGRCSNGLDLAIHQQNISPISKFWQFILCENHIQNCIVYRCGFRSTGL